MTDIVSQIVQDQNPHQFYENVVPDASISEVIEKWNSMLNLRHVVHNAVKSGAMASRPGLYWSNHTDISQLQDISARNNIVCLEQGWRPQNWPLPKLVAAGDDTEDKPYVVQDFTNFRRLVTPDERDRINPGLAAGGESPLLKLKRLFLCVCRLNETR